MNPKTSHKIIAGGAMAAVVVGIAIYELSSNSVPPAAEVSGPLTPAAQVAETPAAVAQTPDAPAAVVTEESLDTKSAGTSTPPAVEPKVVHSRRLAGAGPSAVATDVAVTPTRAAADSRSKSAFETVANRSDRAQSAEDVTMTPGTVSLPIADELKAETRTEVAASDSQITIDVKSAIAGDSISKDLNIGVSTTHGVVALSGSLANQDAIDQVKGVAGSVKDVKSVDTSALLLASR
jgi:hyperosmotically inducible protein